MILRVKCFLLLTLFLTWDAISGAKNSVSGNSEDAGSVWTPPSVNPEGIADVESSVHHKLLRPARSAKNSDREHKKGKSKRKEGRKRIAISLVEKIVEEKLKEQLDPLATALRIVRLDAFSEGILRQLTNMEHIQSQLLTELGVLRAAVNEVGRHTLDLGRQVVGIDERLTALGRQLPHRLDLSGSRSNYRPGNGVRSPNVPYMSPTADLLTDALVSMTTKLTGTERNLKKELQVLGNRTVEAVRSSQSVLERRISKVALDTERLLNSVEMMGNKSLCKSSSWPPVESFFRSSSFSPQSANHKFGFHQATRDELAYFPAENPTIRRDERHYPPSITPYSSRTVSQAGSSMSSSTIAKLASEISKRINIDREFPKDCFDIGTKGGRRSGPYSIYPASCNRRFVVKVWCELEQSSGGWTVIQKRGSSTGGMSKAPVDFFRYWVEYKWGFGDLNTEHWLGNEYLHEMTKSGDYDLRIELQDWAGEVRWAEYSHFSIDDESKNYTLHFTDYSGNAGNSLKHHQGTPFSTRDRDNDSNPKGNCARTFHGAWWFTSCHESHLNGQYHRGRHKSYGEGINWLAFRGHNYSLKKSRMMIRPSFGNA